MSVWGFPDPVNEVAARTVAAGVVTLSALTLLLSATAGSGWLWLSALLAAGFLARVCTGPTLSPLGRFAMWLAPRLATPRPVPGPPKRFAQGIGATLTVAAVVLLALGVPAASAVLVAMVLVAAFLESAFALCLGCRIFAVLMRAGVIPEETCAACADITRRDTLNA